MFIGTKFVNYYYNFFYMYKQLDYNQKFKYFSNNSLIKLIGKNQKLKNFVSIYILTPFIKLNYLIISTLIYLLYALCDCELDNILLQNGFNSLNSSVREEKEIADENILKTSISSLVSLNDSSTFEDNLSMGNKSPSSLKTDVDLFISMVNLTESPKNITSDNSLDDIINFKILNDNTNVEDVKDQNKDLDNDKESVSDNNLDEYLIKNEIMKENNEDVTKNNNSEIAEMKEFIDLIEMKKNNEETKVILNENETISIDEVDFGDYMSDLINKSDEKDTIINTKITTETIPIKIKIGKKKNKL